MPGADPARVGWVGQASIHIAQDDELLELMVRSGCRGVLIGMESLDPANLRDMGKSWNVAAASYADSLRRFRKHGLAVYGTFVFGYDNDDRQVVQRSIDFALEHKLFLAAFNHLVPFPGTPLYEPAPRRAFAEAEMVARSGEPGGRRDVSAEEGVAGRTAGTLPGSAAALLLLELHPWTRGRRRANAASSLMTAIYLRLHQCPTSTSI